MLNRLPARNAAHAESQQFISAVCWRGETPTIVAANSQGILQVFNPAVVNGEPSLTFRNAYRRFVHAIGVEAG